MLTAALAWPAEPRSHHPHSRKRQSSAVHESPNSAVRPRSRRASDYAAPHSSCPANIRLLFSHRPPHPPRRPSVQMDVPVNLSRRRGAVLGAGRPGRAPTRIRPPQGPHLQCRSCRCRSMRRRLGTDRQYHWGSRPAGTTEADGAGPGARSTYPISHAAPTRGILRRRTHMDAMMGDWNGRGDDGESVYGEKADIRLLFGEGINDGDCTAIIMMNPAHDDRVRKREKALRKR